MTYEITSSKADQLEQSNNKTCLLNNTIIDRAKGLLAMAGNVTNQQTLPMTVGVAYSSVK